MTEFYWEFELKQNDRGQLTLTSAAVDETFIPLNILPDAIKNKLALVKGTNTHQDSWEVGVFNLSQATNGIWTLGFECPLLKDSGLYGFSSDDGSTVLRSTYYPENGGWYSRFAIKWVGGGVWGLGEDGPFKSREDALHNCLNTTLDFFGLNEMFDYHLADELKALATGGERDYRELLKQYVTEKALWAHNSGSTRTIRHLENWADWLQERETE